MKTGTKNAREEATKKLIEAGAVCEKREDRHGETKSGWWQDGVFLARDPREALRLLEIEQ